MSAEINKPTVVVVVLNWNRGEDTVRCLETLYKQAYTDFSVVVVDNASTDGSPTRILHWAQSQCFLKDKCVRLTRSTLRDSARSALQIGGFTLVDAGSNGGYAAGNNLGIQIGVSSNAKYIWLLNNDTELHEDALAELVARADGDNRMGMCGSILVDYEDRETVQAIGGVKFDFIRASGSQVGNGDRLPGEAERPPSLTYIAGASLLARTEMIREIGLLEERYFLYYEEIDWAQRAAHWGMGVATKSYVYHKEGGTIGTRTLEGRSKLAQYYLTRNILLFYFRFHRRIYPLAVLKVLKDLVAETVKGTGLARITFYGLLDGLRQRSGPVAIENINRQ